MTKTELIKGILEKAEQLKTSCSIETVMIIDEMEKLIDTYSEQLNLHNVSVSSFLKDCGVGAKVTHERFKCDIKEEH